MENINYGQITVAVAISAGVIRIITRFLETETRMPEFYKIVKFFWLGLLILLVIAESFGIKFFTIKYLEILSIVVLYLLYESRKKSANIKQVLITIIPFIGAIFLIDFFKFLVPKFYEKNDEYFNNFRGFTVMWLLGFGIYVQKQNKREKIRRQKEEVERQILEEKKNSLEHQVAERTAELTQQKEALERTVLELKTTQNQLIQSEKLASLGELTAGIAHEIQNPLNFVNNFSEMSVELIEELKSPLTPEGGMVEGEKIDMELLADIIQNLEKINHHGKRASSIVKGMLEHSRTSTGQKELTDINALADEYLRLSYHGLRAKDKAFNAVLKTDFDDKIQKVNIVPQDIGRVILNLITNAFYTVTEKKKEIPQGYEPTVSVSSKKFDDRIELKIRDNGNGIPEKVLDKIFQPFFTTKPTGQGTGLGLSLSYDIVKAHGGTLECESVVGEGTTFIIKLPTS